MFETQHSFFDQDPTGFQPQTKKSKKTRTFSRLQEIRKRCSETELRLVHAEMVTAARDLKISEARVIRKLQLVDQFLVYRFMDYRSLFLYAVKELSFSRDQAYDFTSVARKAAKLSRLQKAIDQGEVTVSKVRKMRSVINEENQAKWVELAKRATKDEIERAVAEVSPRAARGERKRRLAKDLSEISYPIHDQGLETIERVRTVTSKKNQRHVTLEEASIEMAEFYLDHHDPIRKAQRAMARKEKAQQNKSQPMPSVSNQTFAQANTNIDASTSQESGQNVEIRPEPKSNTNSLKLPMENMRTAGLNSSAQTSFQRASQQKDPIQNDLSKRNPHQTTSRRPIPASSLHQVHLRDLGRCQARKSDGTLCGEERWTEIHHLHEVARGGGNHPDNLLTLCDHHHRMQH